MREMRNAYKILVGKTEYENPLGRISPTWEDLQGLGYEGVDCIYLALYIDQRQTCRNRVTNLLLP
jgi:hypothetical protein